MCVSSAYILGTLNDKLGKSLIVRRRKNQPRTILGFRAELLQAIVSDNRWLRCVKTYRLSWYLTGLPQTMLRVIRPRSFESKKLGLSTIRGKHCICKLGVTPYLAFRHLQKEPKHCLRLRQSGKARIQKRNWFALRLRYDHNSNSIASDNKPVTKK